MPDSGKAYLGDVPLLKEEEEPIFIDDTGKEYYEADCHIFVANGNTVRFPVPSDDPDNCPIVFVAVDGVEVTPTYLPVITDPEEIERWSVVADADQIVHAIFDWDNAHVAGQIWFSDILQFGLNSETGKRNQLKSGDAAFSLMLEANPAAISNLDVSNLTSLRYMFAGSLSFNQPLSKWDTSNVEDMRDVFNCAESFNSDITGWDTSNVEKMTSIFYEANAFNQDISGWDISKLTSIRYMFAYTSFNHDISGWDTSKVTDMYGAFEGAKDFNSDISGWNTSNVTEMGFMFSETKYFNQDISGWDVSKVVPVNPYNSSMNGMFQDATSFNQDLSQWCVSSHNSRPTDFDKDATSWTKPRPQWGKCP